MVWLVRRAYHPTRDRGIVLASASGDGGLGLPADQHATPVTCGIVTTLLTFFDHFERPAFVSDINRTTLDVVVVDQK
jgi:hypothetical protein